MAIEAVTLAVAIANAALLAAAAAAFLRRRTQLRQRVERLGDLQPARVDTRRPRDW